jgi:pimeloyl-ACP methyl ester carboxylesterase
MVVPGYAGGRHVDEQVVTIGSQQIGFLQSAGSERTVILVHGNSSSARTWRRLMAGPLGQRFRCLALDLPGHGQSAPASDHSAYSLPGYAATLTGFAGALDAEEAVIVGWSLGGHIAIESAPDLPRAAGFLIFGTPPVASAAQLADAFLPSPVLNTGFSASVSPAEALAYAGSFVAPGSALPLDDFVADILRTDGAARAGLAASIADGRFADQADIAATLGRPLAVLQGDGEQLISLGYLQRLAIPTLWRGAVQIIPAAGHAPHQEAPEEFASLLEQFITDLD